MYKIANISSVLQLSPISRRRLAAFSRNKRAKYSLFIFLAIFILTLFAEFLANDKPLLVKYQGDFYIPVIRDYSDLTFGGDFPTPADYKDKYTIDKIEQIFNKIYL